MKLLLIPLLLFTLSISCKKTTAEIDKLPPITQTGANTFGCLINGIAYIPSGNDGNFSNFRLDIDPSLDSGGVLIRVYCLKNGAKEKITIGSTGIKKIGEYTISNMSFTKMDIEFDFCSTTSITDFFSIGVLQFTKYDLINNIYSGTFSCKIKSSQCIDTVYITDGRFDKKL